MKQTTKSAGMRSCAPKELALSVLYIATLRKWRFPVQNPENMERFIRLYRKHVCKQTILVSSFLIVIQRVVNVDIHWFLCRITRYASYAIHLIIESFANVRGILLHAICWVFFPLILVLLGVIISPRYNWNRLEHN